MLSALTLAACGTPTDVDVLRVAPAGLSTASPLVRTLTLELDRTADVAVDYWTEGDPHPRAEAPGSQSASVVLTRLRPGRSYQYHGARSRSTSPPPSGQRGASRMATR